MIKFLVFRSKFRFSGQNFGFWLLLKGNKCQFSGFKVTILVSGFSGQTFPVFKGENNQISGFQVKILVFGCF